MSDLIGQRLGQYEILAVLGRGGMAVVYRARQESMKRDVAVKVIKTNLAQVGDFLDRFSREAQMVALLSHPHILKVFDYGQQGDQVFLVMELLTGGSLAGMIKQGPLPLAIAARALDQIGSALDHAHRRGIIHRDLKPQNILLDEEGNTFLTDFGIAKLINDTTSLTNPNLTIGTPAYMSPEQCEGRPLDQRADVYALGILMFELLAGQVPFNADTPLSVMYMHIHTPPPSLRKLRAGVPPGLETVLNKALAKNPDDRFSSAGDFAVAFRTVLEGGYVPAPESLSAPPASVPSHEWLDSRPIMALPVSHPPSEPAVVLRPSRPLSTVAGISVAISVVVGAVWASAGLLALPQPLASYLRAGLQAPDAGETSPTSLIFLAAVVLGWLAVGWMLLLWRTIAAYMATEKPVWSLLGLLGFMGGAAFPLLLLMLALIR